MGGRGSSGGVGGVGLGSKSAEYKQHYETEISNKMDFAASFAVGSGVTKSEIGYQMYVHKDVTGRSLISDTNNEISFLKSELRNANSMGKSYGMSKDAIDGMKAGIKEKISVMESAVSAMQGARGEYERYVREAGAGNYRSRSRGGNWM